MRGSYFQTIARVSIFHVDQQVIREHSGQRLRELLECIPDDECTHQTRTGRGLSETFSSRRAVRQSSIGKVLLNSTRIRDSFVSRIRILFWYHSLFGYLPPQTSSTKVVSGHSRGKVDLLHERPLFFSFSCRTLRLCTTSRFSHRHLCRILNLQRLARDL